MARRTDIDPALRPMLEAWDEAFGPEMLERPAEEVRAAMDAFGAEARPPRPSEVRVEEAALDIAEDRDLTVRIYRPVAHAGVELPVLVYFHGGGWVLGTLDTHDPLCCALALASGIAVASVDYRLAPEHPFPAGLQDCFAAVGWLAERGGELKLDPRRLAVGGDSAGGNLAAAVALIARERAGPPIAFQLLLYPALDTDFERPSYRENADGPVLTCDFAIWFWRHYLGQDLERPTPLAAPLRAGALAGLPPAYILTLQFDPLRDEGEAYAAALEEAGAPVEHRRADALFHGALRAAGVSARVDAEITAAGRAISCALAPGG